MSGSSSSSRAVKWTWPLTFRKHLAGPLKQQRIFVSSLATRQTSFLCASQFDASARPFHFEKKNPLMDFAHLKKLLHLSPLSRPSEGGHLPSASPPLSSNFPEGRPRAAGGPQRLFVLLFTSRRAPESMFTDCSNPPLFSRCSTGHFHRLGPRSLPCSPPCCQSQGLRGAETSCVSRDSLSAAHSQRRWWIRRPSRFHIRFLLLLLLHSSARR